jgi:hypothetical protein
LIPLFITDWLWLFWGITFGTHQLRQPATVLVGGQDEFLDGQGQGYGQERA